MMTKPTTERPKYPYLVRDRVPVVLREKWGGARRYRLWLVTAERPRSLLCHALCFLDENPQGDMWQLDFYGDDTWRWSPEWKRRDWVEVLDD